MYYQKPLLQDAEPCYLVDGLADDGLHVILRISTISVKTRPFAEELHRGRRRSCLRPLLPAVMLRQAHGSSVTAVEIRPGSDGQYLETSFNHEDDWQ